MNNGIGYPNINVAIGYQQKLQFLPGSEYNDDKLNLKSKSYLGKYASDRGMKRYESS